MATACATLSPATFSAAAKMATTRGTKKSSPGPKFIVGLNSFGGLKAHTKVGSLGLSVSTERSFANIVSALRGTGGKGGGGALSATCNATAEIFKIAAIMNGLVLVGVAVGFVLLRIEAYVEESE